jgi:hypothetical protein
MSVGGNREKLCEICRKHKKQILINDRRLQSFIVDAYEASKLMANTTVFIDTFIDCDIGYYPRIGLLDRRFNPRPAFYALKLKSLGNYLI